MIIENNGEMVAFIMTPDQAEALSNLILGGLQDGTWSAYEYTEADIDQWERAAENLYQAAYQAFAIAAKNLGG